jgi:phospholipid-binding lipoprotein MlaA
VSDWCRRAAPSAVAAGLFLLLALAGCATPPADPAERAAFEANNDPLEPLNRKIFDLNQVIDQLLLKPAAEVYVAVLPQDGRNAIRRMLDNMEEPVIVINTTLQGEIERASIAVRRLVVNSTIGVAGIFDVASGWGLKRQIGDFGQTLYVWGVPSGPYLIIPVLGPSNPRDALGMAADSYIDPVTFLGTTMDVDDLAIIRLVVDGVDRRARAIDTLDELQKNSLDFYAQLRSLVQQRRAAQLRRGAAPAPPSNFYNVPEGSGTK